jgi:hypothetical protein
MAQSIGSLSFTQQSDPSAPVAVYPISFATDQVWNFTLQGTTNGTPVTCNGVTVDNTGNPTAVAVTVNGVAYPIGQNSRQRIDFNGNPNLCSISSTVATGNCVAQFFVKPPAPNDEGLSQVAVQTQSFFVGGPTANVGNAYTLPASGATALTPAGFAFSSSAIISIGINATNTGAATLSVAGGPATAIHKVTAAGSVALTGTEMLAGSQLILACNAVAGCYDIIGAVAGSAQCLMVQDRKASGTAGTALAIVGWTDHDCQRVILNTITGASLADPNITLPAGTYDVEAACCFVLGTGTDKTQLRLFNTSSGTVQTDISGAFIVGLSAQGVGGAGGSFALGNLSSRFTLGAAAQVKFQQFCSSGAGSMGVAQSGGQAEIYLIAKFSKVT